MNANTCATLAQIFPVFFLAAILESGRTHFRIRTRPWYRRWIVSLGLGAGFVGMLVAVLGVELAGLGVFGAIVWLCFVVATGCLCAQLVAIAATEQVEDDATTPGP